MKFGIKTSQQFVDWRLLVDTWQAADDLEVFESAWNFDHFYPIFADPTGPCLDGWSMLAAMAALTKRIRIGCMVTGNVYRHPAVLAKMVASVDVISNGRLEFGFGAGWSAEECAAYGIELPPLRQRFDRLDEACAVITGLLGNTVTDFDGEHYRLTNAYCEPKPIQRPYPPLCIGGGGRRRTLRTVARFADHWNSPAETTAEFLAQRRALTDHCAAIGRDVHEIRTSSHVRIDNGFDPSAVSRSLDEWAAVGLDLAILMIRPPFQPAVVEQLAQLVEH